MKNNKNIKCPHCNKSIDISEAYMHEIELDLQENYNQKLSSETKKIEQSLVKKIEKDYLQKMDLQNSQIKSMEKIIEDKNIENAKHEELKRRYRLQKSEYQIELQKALNINEQEINSKHEIEKKSLLKQLKDQSDSHKENIKRIEQGSVQLQGEAQELSIEDWLKKQFIYDTISEIKKGKPGADCLQEIYDGGNLCGSIYYESKRTKSFQNSWIEKFKDDMRKQKSDIGILVTATLPKNINKCTRVEGNIYICSFNEFKIISSVLRQMIIAVSVERGFQKDKSKKESLIYDFLTSKDFKIYFESIVDSCLKIKQSTDKEKFAMMKIWADRDIHSEKMIANICNIYSSITSLAGIEEIENIKSLELTDENDHILRK